MKCLICALPILLLAACASAPPPVNIADEPARPSIYDDASFAPSPVAVSPDDIFALSPDMRRFLDTQIARRVSTEGKVPALIDALFDKSVIKFSYNANETANAAGVFASHSGNCLSYTIMTAAFAKEMHVPVQFHVATYADVWEFWLRHPDVAGAVDFITIHILPYWEDFPIPAAQAAAHVEAIREKVARALPGKEIVIGEVGWPSAGRMREGALPSNANQARVIQDVLALAKRENFKVNVIESFDAPWKRAQEGTVGGHWGLLDGGSREPKFAFGAPVSNHPHWRWQAAAGLAFAFVIFAAAFATGRRHKHTPIAWLAVTVNAIAGGVLIGWAVENVGLESLGLGMWIRSVALVAVALAGPVVASMTAVAGTPWPAFASVLSLEGLRRHDRLAAALGLVVVVTLILSLQIALGLVFDPRYKDFPFAPLTAAVVPLFVHGLVVARGSGRRGAAETAGMVLLALSVVYIVPNEGFANWQSLWLCAALAAFALRLFLVRAAPG